eukprot:CAMPEP_0174244000 /NCGR_PEP_ID=MMETSP0417-20130205/33629_1 /TAXON_ID=242541 /ORGANISM="Mayorella sp, Strain BSH-02190019" /LENGTH=444 /DNA_ID=CAMNT_0015323615 /DNA_START=20 /DNA_END=1350 /DNA_ORIENTATION=+
MTDSTVPTQALDGYTQEEDAPEQHSAWAELTSLVPSIPSYTLTEDEVTVGRGEENTIVLQSPVVSGNHANFQHEIDPVSGEHLVFIQDTSTNGTYVDNKKLGKGNRLCLDREHEITFVQARKGIEKISFRYKAKIGEVQREHPDVTSKYYITRSLGAGAFAEVKLGKNKSTGAQFAIKIIKKNKMKPIRKRDVLMEEVNILKKVDHLNIIKIEEVIDTEDKLYLVLELVTGGELFEFIVKYGTVPEDTTRILMKQMLEALYYLHENGIAHRDLKPENVLLKDDTYSEIKISDFGLSRVVGEQSFMSTMCGTPQYLAPEVLNNPAVGKGYDKAVDLWSLGVIMYTMLAGYNPFDDPASGEEGPSVFDQVRLGEYTFPEEEWDRVSAGAKDLVRKLMTVDPAKRITAEEALQHPWISPENTMVKRAASVQASPEDDGVSSKKRSRA